MSESTKKDTKPVLRDEDMETSRVGRRSSLAILGAAVAGVALVGATPSTAEASCSDRDPNDPGGRGRGNGVTDRDPNDSVNCGRGRSGVTDSDPNDQAGNGRGRRSCSDSDPNDRGGHGRNC